VGIYAQRSSFRAASLTLNTIIALLGILKAGGAYLPLDPALPAESLAFRLQDAKAAVLLTQKGLLKREDTQTHTVVYLDADWELIAQEFRGRQAPPKPDAKGLLPGKLPRQIPSLLTMKQAGVARLVTSRILCMVKKNGLIIETRPLSKCYLNFIKTTCKNI